jgi:hypothetical protein
LIITRKRNYIMITKLPQNIINSLLACLL